MQTPYVLVDVDRMEANLAAMAGRCAAAGVALRPHAKTHKSLTIARRQLELGAVGLTVATIGEAEVFAAVCEDLFIAYPLWVTPEAADRLRGLASAARVQIGVASVEGARRLGAMLPDSDALGIEVMVEVDSGHHRTGVRSDLAGEVASVAADAGLDVAGVFTFPGHGYGPDQRVRAAEDEATALGQAASSLRDVGIEPRVISGGSTPTAQYADSRVLSEVRPGVYPFLDAQQVELGTGTVDQVALTCVATVIHRDLILHDRPRSESARIVLDAGSKVIGADRPAWASGSAGCWTIPTPGSCSSPNTMRSSTWGRDTRSCPHSGNRCGWCPITCAAASTWSTACTPPPARSGPSMPAGATPDGHGFDVGWFGAGGLRVR